jgi:HD-like signal output (HDOD) protein
MLSTRNDREANVLDVAFRQKGIMVVRFNPSRRFFVKVHQQNPDIILMEFPPEYKDQMDALHLFGRNRKLAKVPVIAFGDSFEDKVLSIIFNAGVREFIERPLKFSGLMQSIVKALEKSGNRLEGGAAGGNAERDPTDPEDLFRKDVPVTKKLKLIVDNVAQMLAFPFTLARVLQITGDRNKGAAELAKAIEADPVIAAQILKVSNSVFFANLNRRICSIRDAVVRIGFEETKRIVMGVSVMGLFKPDGRNVALNRTEFWYHCLGTALIAEDLARSCDTINRDEAFLAGLLHDFGIIILDEFFPGVLEKIMEITGDNAGAFVRECQSAIALEPGEVAAELFERWRMPESILSVMGGCYDFLHPADSQENKKGLLADITGIAEQLCKALSIGAECDQFVSSHPNDIMEKVGLKRGVEGNFISRILTQMRFYRQFFRIEQREYPSADDGLENIGRMCFGIINESDDTFITPEVYLRGRGARMIKLDRGQSVTVLDGKVDAAIVWTHDPIDAENLRRYRNIVKRYEQNADMSAKPAMAGVVLFSNAHEQQTDGNLRFVCKSTDLRKIDRALIELLDTGTGRFSGNGTETQ